MLHALLFLLLCVTDGEIIADLTHPALVRGLLNAAILGCIGVRITIVHWLANRNQRAARRA